MSDKNEKLGIFFRNNESELKETQPNEKSIQYFFLWLRYVAKWGKNKMELWKNEWKHVNRPTNQIKTLNDGGTCP